MRYIWSLLLGVSLALGPGAGSVEANDNDLGHFLAGLAALAIIGVAIDEAGDRERRKEKALKAKRVEPKVHYKQPIQPNLHRRPDRPHKGKAANWKLLPSRCVRHFGPIGFERRVFGARCLERHFAHVAQLPSYCRTHVRAQNGRHRIAYDARCLRRAGFRMI
ncbi:MAG: hypothetical protein AAGD04_08485 [Pseudomonadota bacterium]